MAAETSSSGNLIADRRYGYGQALLKEGDAVAAADLFRQTLELAPDWHPAWFSLGEALLKADAKAQAVTAFQRALALDTGDTLGAKLRLAHLGETDPATAMTPDYVAALFDHYADRFDVHLTGALDYRGPEIITQALALTCARQGRIFHFGHAVDLGCGTGLMAAALIGRTGSINGIDLSPLMVEKARQSGHYGKVECGDLIPYLEAQKTAAIDLLTAADVLVYVSALGALFAAARRTMTTTAIFAFTVQSWKGDSFNLGEDMRYHHSESYLSQTATESGLEVLYLSPCVTRKDAGKAVAGFVVLLGHASAKHDD